MCCCTRLHRHQIHLISYGCVSFGLITTGLVFTVFAIFQKESQIGKVWLAGPTTMVVGLVLCGKVIIDWGPAMMHAREGSLDSRLDEHMAQQMVMKAPPNNHNSYHVPNQNHMLQMAGASGECITSAGIVRNSHPVVHKQTSMIYANPHAKLPVMSAKKNGTIPVGGISAMEHPDCIVYSQYDTPHGSTSVSKPIMNAHIVVQIPKIVVKFDEGGETSSVHHSQLSTHTSSSATIVSPEHSVKESTCECSKYGSMRKTPYNILPPSRTMYQGESFLMNERSFLI